MLLMPVPVLNVTGCASAPTRWARAAVSRDPAAADGSPSGAAAVDLLAYMLGRVSDRAEELAGVVDLADIAGLTGARAYDEARPALG